ncbi:hypothetical protein OSB04_un000195 [Centaurea solstitialis]|uniref:Reverse transcriptase zinc-binding domain-containing protein n=1 Tax=Centaurea solstitialis TaxID=347529 RepID=A0AA38W658_9ASTR|nr:hypothetical protein OSB04_un000195 [Centaurea solstitialis]
MFRDFLWAHGSSSKGRCRVAWVDVCKARENGGLGLRRMTTWNRALVSRNLWDILSKKNSLWTSWVRRYYLQSLDFWTCSKKPKWSWVFRKMMDLRESIKVFIRWRLGDGRSINAWEDFWLPCGYLAPLISYRRIHASGFHRNMSAREFLLDTDGIWPEEWTARFPQLLSVTLPVLSREGDVLQWDVGDNHMADFSVARAYSSFDGRHDLVPWYGMVWYKGHVPKYSFCLWLACLRRHPTQDRLRSWKDDPPDLKCSLCEVCEDSHEHLFFSCSFALTIWRQVKMEFSWSSFPDDWDNIMIAISDPAGANFPYVRKIVLAVSAHEYPDCSGDYFCCACSCGVVEARSPSKWKLMMSSLWIRVRWLDMLFWIAWWRRLNFAKDREEYVKEILELKRTVADLQKLLEDKGGQEKQIVELEFAKERHMFETEIEKLTKTVSDLQNTLTEERKVFDLKSVNLSKKISVLERKIILDKKNSLKKPSLRVGKYHMMHDFEEEIQVVQSERKFDEKKSIGLQKHIVDLQNQLSDERSQFKRKEKVLQHEKSVLEQIIAEPKKKSVEEMDFENQKVLFENEIKKLTSKLSGLSTDIMNEQRMRSDQQQKLVDLVEERNKLSAKVKELEEIVFKVNLTEQRSPDVILQSTYHDDTNSVCSFKTAHDSFHVDVAPRRYINSSCQIRSSNIFYDRRVDRSGNHHSPKGLWLLNIQFRTRISFMRFNDIEVSMINPEPEDLPKKHNPRLDLVCEGVNEMNIETRHGPSVDNSCHPTKLLKYLLKDVCFNSHGELAHHLSNLHSEDLDIETRKTSSPVSELHILCTRVIEFQSAS